MEGEPDEETEIGCPARVADIETLVKKSDACPIARRGRLPPCCLSKTCPPTGSDWICDGTALMAGTDLKKSAAWVR
jgi:hypothetical protein